MITAFLIGAATGSIITSAVMWFLGGRDIAKCKRQVDETGKRHVEAIDEFLRLTAARIKANEGAK